MARVLTERGPMEEFIRTNAPGAVDWDEDDEEEDNGWTCPRCLAQVRRDSRGRICPKCGWYEG